MDGRELLSHIALAVTGVAVLLDARLAGELWLRHGKSAAWLASLLATALALTVFAVIEWGKSRTYAERRLQALLNAYAEREIARERQRRSSRPAA